MATRHDAAVDEPDQQLLVDIDLGILGQPRAIFDAYDAAIRREYHWLPWPRYAETRVAVLTGFLDRPHIYSTPPLRERFEKQARSNIAYAIATLKQDS
jgi:predicted metal-dependent HD superfamily phosphohydrolase